MSDVNINDAEFFEDTAEESEEPEEGSPEVGESVEGEDSTEGASQAAPEAPQVDEKALFSDESLSTVEGVANARAYLKARQEATATEAKKARDTYIAVKKREQKLNERNQRVKQKEDNLTALDQQIQANLKILRSPGNPRERLQALGRLAGGDGHKIYTEMSEYMIGRTPESDTVAELRQTVAGLRGEIENMLNTRDQRQQLEQRNQQLRSQYQQIRQSLYGAAQKAAPLAHMLRSDPERVVDALCDLKREAGNSGQWLSDERAVAILTENWTGQSVDLRTLGQVTEPATAGNPDAGRETSSPRPGTAPRLPSTSLTSNTVAAGTTTRPMDDDERLDAAVNDPAFWKELGLPGFA